MRFQFLVTAKKPTDLGAPVPVSVYTGSVEAAIIHAAAFMVDKCEDITIVDPSTGFAYQGMMAMVKKNGLSAFARGMLT